MKWLRPALLLEEIKDEDLVKKKYRYWRLRTFYGMYIGYAFYYFTRKSFTFAMPSMLNHGFTLSELGVLGSILVLALALVSPLWWVPASQRVVQDNGTDEEESA